MFDRQGNKEVVALSPGDHGFCANHPQVLGAC